MWNSIIRLMVLISSKYADLNSCILLSYKITLCINRYADFAPMFTCELFDADAWADIFAKSGAKYVVLTSVGLILHVALFLSCVPK